MEHLLFNANWNFPTAVRVGPGRIKELSAACIEMGMRNPLLVTDPGLVSLPMVQVVMQRVIDDGLSMGLFSQVKSNPTGETITHGLSAYQAGHHDGVIALGGGSAIDAGKAIALMVGQDRPLWDFEDVGDNWTRVNIDGMAPVVAIPTTAGTGSEVGRASVITDSAQKTKKIIFHPNLLPKIVILDPELTLGLPPNITAATGMDALSHHVEAYCSTAYHPMAEGIAIEGIRLIQSYLPRAVANGNDREARMHMLVASCMGATAFQRGLGAMHALAHPLGALYDAHHGRLNAILMPYVLQANRAAIETKMTQLSKYLDIQNGFDGLLEWIINLRHAIGIEHSLAEIGIGEQHVDRIAIMATQDAAANGNPILFNVQQYQTLLSAAIRGVL